MWREVLLARKVLEGNTVGYKHHPQLIRFKRTENPVLMIEFYLGEVFQEAVNRNFNFNPSKTCRPTVNEKIPVTRGQADFEAEHLLRKLKDRDIKRYSELSANSVFDLHPIFELIDGDIEEWERQS